MAKKIFPIINTSNKQISICQRSASKMAVICVHGFLSSYENILIKTISQELNKKDFTTFAFDFTGCGRSDEDILSIETMLDDLMCVYNFIKSQNYNSISIVAHSLGSLITLLLAKKLKFDNIILVAPVTQKPHYSIEEKYTPKQVEDLNNHGIMEFEAKNRKEGYIFVDKEVFYFRRTIVQEELAKDISSKITIIHGDEDERVPYTDSVRFCEVSTAKLIIMKGANHSFRAKLKELCSNILSEIR